MWAQLAMAGLKSVADNQANKQNIASNVITQKYSPWTGQRADFSAQGRNSAASNMIAGFGSGMLQDKLDADALSQKTAQAVSEKAATDASDGDFYQKLSANPASVGVSPINQKSAFASMAQAQPMRAPAQGGPDVDMGMWGALPQGPSMNDQAKRFSSNPWSMYGGR